MVAAAHALNLSIFFHVWARSAAFHFHMRSRSQLVPLRCMRRTSASFGFHAPLSGGKLQRSFTNANHYAKAHSNESAADPRPNRQTQTSRWQYEILKTCPIIMSNDLSVTRQPLPKVLKRLNWYPSYSQAKKACQFGAIIISRAKEAHNVDKGEDYIDNRLNAESIINLDSNEYKSLNEKDRVMFVASSNTLVIEGDIIVVRTRLPHSCYPISCTKYVHPPAYLEQNSHNDSNNHGNNCYNQSAHSDEIKVLYEDEYISVIHKPELLSTIGGGEHRQDLQSCLPFILSPPPQKYWPSSQPLMPPVPRPVHRLDRRTSGLVLVAKTKGALSTLSQDFSTRNVQKNYMAIVFGTPNNDKNASAGGSDSDSTASSDTNNREFESSWNVIDYPIDGKPSVTLWQSLQSIQSPEFGTLALVSCRPKTGRYHQIRRHLSYCLGTPIVGDNKYDGGGDIFRSARSLGMFLCSNAVVFKHPIFKNPGVDADVCEAIQSLPVLNKLETDRFMAFVGDSTQTLLGGCDGSSVQKSVNRVHSGSNSIDLYVSIPLPPKFHRILRETS